MTSVVDRPTTPAERARAQRAASLATEPLAPASPAPALLAGTGQSLRDIWRYRELLGMLFKRELKVRYKDSVLGFVWTLLRPLAQLLVYAIAIGQFLGASKGLPDYPIYVFAGLATWQLFAEIVSSGTGSLLANAGLIKKIYLPREVFPLSVVASALFNFSMQVVILLAGIGIAGRFPQPSRLPYALLSVGVVVSYATALALVLGAVNVYLRDTQYLVEICLMWGLWTAPIVYRWSQVASTFSHHTPWLRRVYLANPITEATLGFQRAFWARGTAVDTITHLAAHMLGSLAVGLLLLALAQRVFSRLQSNFAQEL